MAWVSCASHSSHMALLCLQYSDFHSHRDAEPAATPTCSPVVGALGRGCLTFRQGHAHLQHSHKVLDITLDTLGHTRVLQGEDKLMSLSQPGRGGSRPIPRLPPHLYLQGHLCPILQHTLVHLPNGGSSKWHFLQGSQLGLPVMAQFLFENFLRRVVAAIMVTRVAMDSRAYPQGEGFFSLTFWVHHKLGPGLGS